MPRAIVLLGVALLASCGGSEPAPTPAEPNANFILYVSNQSFDVDPVDIRVMIDGRAVVDQDFAVENQHNWIEFSLRLAEGRHELRAESTAGEARLVRSFDIAGKTWAVLDYWFYQGDPKHFTFTTSRQPIAFA